MVVTVGATQARNEWFDILELTKINKQITDIMLNGEVVATISPKKKEGFDWDEYKKEIDMACRKLRESGWEPAKDFRKKFKFRRYKGW